jgi:hypothetical protein
VRPFRLITTFLAISALQAAPAIFPLKDVRAGQRGVGRTVFSGSRVEEFQVDILGVLENIGPRQSIILARLRGGPLAQTGVMQGMSGSPVYIDGRLAGAVALSFPLSKEAIAGIRPIEDMLRIDPDPKPARNVAQNAARNVAMDPRRQFVTGDARLEEIATPVSFSGFTAATLDHFSQQLKGLGLDPRQGVSGGGKPSDQLGDPGLLEPGSMISVQLLSGDMSVGADGTVTSIDGNRIYAFGHRFLDGGSTDLPFARAEVLTLLPNLSSSFKISTAREWMGTITEDRETAVSGLLGKRAAMTPLEIHVGTNVYHMRMIEDRVMTPLVAQMAVFSAMDATERAVGAAAYTVRGRLDFQGGSVRLDNVYSGDVGVAAFAALGVSSPLQVAFSSGFGALKLKGLTLDVGVVDRRSHLEIADAVAPRMVRPGEEVELAVTLSGENGVETAKKVRYRVPVGAPAGPLYFTVSDATSTNLLEFQSALGTPLRAPSQVLGLLNAQRTNTKAYVRVWRAGTAYTVDGRDLPDLPPSVAMILARGQIGSAALLNARGSKIAEIEIPAGDYVVTGSKTVQVEVKE